MARRTQALAKAIGRRLERARQARGLTVRELADLAMVHRNTVLGMAEGRSLNPGAGTLYDLAKALGVTPAWLICGVGDGPEG